MAMPNGNASEVEKKKRQQLGSSYGSAWNGQLNDTVSQILQRKPFDYNLDADALYQHHKDRYTQQGKMAMMDTMGQAAALTGGYGSSYAQQAGQQAYQRHLQSLDDVVPELYQLAMSMYKAEGQDLMDRLSVLSALDDRDYARYQDRIDRDRQAAEDARDFELSVAELMAGAGDYERLAKVYGLSDSEVSRLRLATQAEQQQDDSPWKKIFGWFRGDGSSGYTYDTYLDRKQKAAESGKTLSTPATKAFIQSFQKYYDDGYNEAWIKDRIEDHLENNDLDLTDEEFWILNDHYGLGFENRMK